MASFNVGSIFATLKLDTKGINASLRNVRSPAKTAGKALKSQFDGASKSASNLTKTIGGIGKGVSGLIRRLTSLRAVLGGVAAGFGAFQLVSFAKQIANTDESFGRLVLSLGANATEALQKLRVATRGTVSDFDLLRNANQAIILGVGKNIDELAFLAEAARRLGKATGRDASQGFADLALGIGRQSRLILDNLGIIVRVDEAIKQYANTLGIAADKLTAVDRAQAFTNATLDAIRDKLERLGPDAINFADAVGVAKASLTNFTTDIARNATPALQRLLLAFGDLNAERLSFTIGAGVGLFVEQLANFVTQNGERVISFFTRFAKSLSTIATVAANLTTGTIEKLFEFVDADAENRSKLLAKQIVANISAGILALSGVGLIILGKILNALSDRKIFEAIKTIGEVFGATIGQSIRGIFIRLAGVTEEFFIDLAGRMGFNTVKTEFNDLVFDLKNAQYKLAVSTEDLLEAEARLEDRRAKGAYVSGHLLQRIEDSKFFIKEAREEITGITEAMKEWQKSLSDRSYVAQFAKQTESIGANLEDLGRQFTGLAGKNLVEAGTTRTIDELEKLIRYIQDRFKEAGVLPAFENFIPDLDAAISSLLEYQGLTAEELVQDEKALDDLAHTVLRFNASLGQRGLQEFEDSGERAKAAIERIQMVLEELPEGIDRNIESIQLFAKELSETAGSIATFDPGELSGDDYSEFKQEVEGVGASVKDLTQEFLRLIASLSQVQNSVDPETFKSYESAVTDVYNTLIDVSSVFDDISDQGATKEEVTELTGLFERLRDAIASFSSTSEMIPEGTAGVMSAEDLFKTLQKILAARKEEQGQARTILKILAETARAEELRRRQQANREDLTKRLVKNEEVIQKITESAAEKQADIDLLRKAVARDINLEVERELATATRLYDRSANITLQGKKQLFYLYGAIDALRSAITLRKQLADQVQTQQAAERDSLREIESLEKQLVDLRIKSLPDDDQRSAELDLIRDRVRELILAANLSEKEENSRLARLNEYVDALKREEDAQRKSELIGKAQAEVAASILDLEQQLTDLKIKRLPDEKQFAATVKAAGDELRRQIEGAEYSVKLQKEKLSTVDRLVKAIIGESEAQEQASRQLEAVDETLKGIVTLEEQLESIRQEGLSDTELLEVQLQKISGEIQRQIVLSGQLNTEAGAKRLIQLAQLLRDIRAANDEQVRSRELAEASKDALNGILDLEAELVSLRESNLPAAEQYEAQLRRVSEEIQRQINLTRASDPVGFVEKSIRLYKVLNDLRAGAVETKIISVEDEAFDLEQSILPQTEQLENRLRRIRDEVLEQIKLAGILGTEEGDKRVQRLDAALSKIRELTAEQEKQQRLEERAEAIGGAVNRFGQDLTRNVIRAFETGGDVLLAIGQAFTSALEDQLQTAIGGLSKAIGEAFAGAGPLAQGIGGAFAAVAAVGGAILARQRESGSTFNELPVEEIATSQQAVRGVVAGPQNIAIAEVGAGLREAFRGTESLLSDILEEMRVLNGNALSAGGVGSAGSV